MSKFFKVPLQFAGFFGILIVLLWLQVPFIPGVHGIFQDILDVSAALLFYWLVGVIFKSSAQRKASSRNP